MRKQRLSALVCLAAAVLLAGCDRAREEQAPADAAAGRGTETETETATGGGSDMTENIFWLGHSSIRLEGERVVYIDPWKLELPAKKADIILVSHGHRDHLSPDDIGMIWAEGTVIVTTPDCAAGLPGEVRTMKPGDRLEVLGVTVEAVPAYNPAKRFHPKDKNWLGFIVTLGGKRIYYCGDTDQVPEMETIGADIVLAPVGGTYTMTAEEAAAMVNMVRPAVAIPVHYGDVAGAAGDAVRFRDLCEVPVVIKERWRPAR